MCGTALEGAFEPPARAAEETEKASQHKGWQRPFPVPAAVTALALAVVIGFGVWGLAHRPAAVPTSLMRFSIRLAANQNFTGTGC